ncbi:MAG: ABC transporter permease [Oscillospiraceae bacterium]|nr:ABC transporter permease [Oscillospiraceae bacterium]
MTGLYLRLAASGIRKNGRTYIPYILTCAGMIMMFYIIGFLTYGTFLDNIRGGNLMSEMLGFGVVVMVIFSAIFLFYTNSFLIKRRKKELGLYNILGMGKLNIARIMIWETLIIFALAMVLGIGAGILFSKLAMLGAAKMLGEQAAVAFEVNPFVMVLAMIWYGIIFFLILLNSLRQVFRSRPIELLHSESTGERPPKAKIIPALLGLALLGGAYYMAVTIKDPITAIFTFFLAVIMVIAGTYLLFIAGSVAYCKLLQKSKNYYYKTSHFISVSQMTYRMKRNGAGLASICILSTMVLVTLSSTICLYAGEEKILQQRYPRDIIFSPRMNHSLDVTPVSMRDDAMPRLIGYTHDKLSEYGEEPLNEINYTYLTIAGAFAGNEVILSPKYDFDLLGDVRNIYIIPADECAGYTGEDTELAENEAMIYCKMQPYDFDTITLDEFGTFNIVKQSESFELIGNDVADIMPTIYLFVKDIGVLTDIHDFQMEVYDSPSPVTYYYGFDLDCGGERTLEIYDDLRGGIWSEDGPFSEDSGYYEISVIGNCIESDREEFYALYGGLFFLGILLGSVFILAAVLIMYYKQVSEGFEDNRRFEILQKVGMTKQEIRRSINSQVLTVFFMPLIAAGIHTAFAFQIISKLLRLFAMTDMGFLALVTVCCYIVFAILYIVVYIITSRSYYSIVSSKER